MRLFWAAMAVSFGFALYAVAALVWDRRTQLVYGSGMLARIGRASGAVVIPTSRRLMPYWLVLGLLVGGTGMMVAPVAWLILA